MSEMKAVVYYGAKDIRVKKVPVPLPGSDEIRIKVDACAVCGTDLKTYMSGNPKINPPRIIGHEFTGIVDTIGEEVGGFSIGDRIVMATSVSCGECYYCQKDHPNLCLDVRPMGFKYQGGMTEYTVIPSRALRNGHVVKVPSGVKAEFAALAEPLSCAVNSAQNSNISKGDTVVVVGAGPMGIMNCCIAREMGAEKIILAETNDTRLKIAGPFGFDLYINPAKENLAEKVREETNGIGADLVIVSAPAALPQEQAFEYVRKRGTVCLFASLPVGKNMLSIDSRIIHYNEIKVTGTSDSTPDQVKKAVEFISGGTLPVDKLATHILNLDEILKAYKLMQSGQSLRVILKTA